MTYNGQQVFRRMSVDTNTIEKATVFNNQYTYYYKKLDDLENMQLLGSFQRIEHLSSLLPYHDYDYKVYIFDEGTVYSDKIKNIYCKLVPSTVGDMRIVEGMCYKGQLVYYKIN